MTSFCVPHCKYHFVWTLLILSIQLEMDAYKLCVLIAFSDVGYMPNILSSSHTCFSSIKRLFHGMLVLIRKRRAFNLVFNLFFFRFVLLLLIFCVCFFALHWYVFTFSWYRMIKPFKLLIPVAVCGDVCSVYKSWQRGCGHKWSFNI